MKTDSAFVENLQLLFIFLKLHGDIDWPWRCVLLPLGVAFLVALVGAVGGKDR